MKKPHVVMLGYNHHRHTSKATLYGKPVFLKEKKNKSSQTIMTIFIAHIQGIANLPNTARKLYKMLQSFLHHSKHCGLCTSINKPHQSFEETNRSYGLGTSTHSTALNCSALAKNNSLPLLADQVTVPLNSDLTKLNSY